MTQLDKETIVHLTRLSRIDCSAEEQDALFADLKSILDYMAQMQSVDTESVEACQHPMPEIFDAMRADVPGQTMPQALFLGNAPSHIEGLVRVPPVIKQL